jgi:prepilin-type N-terminal cleavage/methylation domain-containing protein
MRDDKGFTLIEVLVVSLIAAIIAGALIYVLNSSRRASRIAELDSQAQQNARVAIDYVTRDARSAGYGIDVGSGQGGIVYAAPYDLIFNSNIEPEPDDLASPGYPTAINVSSSPATVPGSGTALYSPAATFQTGAETVRFTFDSSNDGVVDDNDKDDEDIESATPNPYDYSLGKQVYGFDGSSNGGSNEAFAMLRGPNAYADGSLPHPLFTYWYDDDDLTATPDVLWGDSDGSGDLDQGEMAAISPVSAANLHRINRIGIHVIGAARSADRRHAENEGYRETVMTSEVSVRNVPLRAAYIRGVVFNDMNSDGTQQTGEVGLAGVVVRLNTGLIRTTGADGNYSFKVDAGTYTVTETDPVGYSSTTPNAVMVTVANGGVVGANFGDRAMGGYGQILGKVILDENVDGVLDPAEPGVDSVDIFLNSGEHDTSDVDGLYGFLVPVSSYSVTMTVPDGYLAVGPTVVNTTLAAEGDTAVVNFGLSMNLATGTIAGKVYNDTDHDGVPDVGESGIASVTLRLGSGDSTLTDGTGYYSFTIAPATYDITEEDFAGYVSTTVNHVTGLVVQADSTVTVNFGDMLATTLSFQVIALGETQRALSISSGDLAEDNRTDQEIILGTKYISGVSNLNVWFNQWQNASTPNSAIFSQVPTYSRTPSEDIFSVDCDVVGSDAVKDVITGMTTTSGRILVWITQTSGANKGRLPNSPTGFFVASGAPDVYACQIENVDSDADKDVVIGTEYGAWSGKLEVWFNDGTGTFTHNAAEDVYNMAGDHLVGSVRSLAVGDLSGSSAKDVVLGTVTATGAGKIEIFRDNGTPTGKLSHWKTIDALGEVNAVAVADMLEDTDGDLDIIAGTATGIGSGAVEVWHNNGDGTFGRLVVDHYEPSDTVLVAGEVLCLATHLFDTDVYPDIAVGIRTTAYSGYLKIYQCYGFMPSSGSEFTSANVGEVITVTVNDFNKDYRNDLAIGTRTSFNQGTVVVFFNQ